MIKLNEDQEKAAEKMLDFIEGRLDLPYFTLVGPAGTGKSYILNETLNRTWEHLFERSAATISHAAKNILENFFKESIPCYTVAQWLGLRMRYTDNGEVIFSRDLKAEPKLKSCKIAILDEASMVSDDLYNDIMNIVNQHKIKLITIGE